jgi:hypothetical protein
VRYLELAVAILYWWHPAAWWVRARLREAEEQCCDAWVVWAMPAAARTYMATLLDAMDFLCERSNRSNPEERPRPAFPATAVLASGMGQFHCLERRLTMVKQQTVRRRLSAGGLAAVVGAAALLLPLGPGLARAVVDDAPTQETKPTTVAPADKGIETAPDKGSEQPIVPLTPAVEEAPSQGVATKVAGPVRPVSGNFEGVPAAGREVSARDEPDRDPTREAAAARDEAAKLRKEVEDLRAQVRKYEELLRTYPALPNAADPNRQSTDDAKHNGIGPGDIGTGSTGSAAVGGKAGNKAPAAGIGLAVKGGPDGKIKLKVGDNEVSAADAATGKVLWVFRRDGVSAPIVQGPHVWVKLAGGREVVLDLETGKLLGEMQSPPVLGIAGNVAVAEPNAGPRGADQEKRLRALEEKLDKLTRVVERLAESRDPGQHTPPPTGGRPGANNSGGAGVPPTP